MKISPGLSHAKLRLERARARFGWFDVVVSTVKRYSSDDGSFYSAALTYYLFFSIFPLLLFAASVLGFVTGGDPAAREKVLDEGLDALPMLGDVLSRTGLEFVERNAGSLALTGTVLALYSGSGVVIALEHALNKVGRVTREGSFLERRLRSLKWLAALGAGVLASLALASFTGPAESLLGDTPPILATLLGLATGFLVNLALFTATFKLLPARPRSIRDVMPGAVVASGAFEVLKAAGNWYLQRGTAAREVTFGAFASAAGLLIAAYLLAQIILYAAELNAVLAERRLTRQASVSEQPRRKS